jgi:hypothetical protein
MRWLAHSRRAHRAALEAGSDRQAGRGQVGRDFIGGQEVAVELHAVAPPRLHAAPCNARSVAPFAHDAVQALPDGRVRVLFKAPPSCCEVS